MSTSSQFASTHRLGQGAGIAAQQQASFFQTNPTTLLPLDETERLLSLTIALKVSDLGACAEGLEVRRAML
jgi:hypothetical protein